MPNYYEILKIQPTATAPEIESAYETQYHPAPPGDTSRLHVVNQANQALQVLEKIRATLTDPAKRIAYDARSGLQGAVVVWRILKLKEHLPVLVPADRSSSARKPEPAQRTPIRTDAWICPKCGRQTRCRVASAKVRTDARINCPKCNTMIEATATFCAVCGGNIQQLTEQKQRRVELIDEQQNLTAQRAQVQQEILGNQDEVNVLKRVAVSAIAWIGWAPMWLGVTLANIRIRHIMDSYAFYTRPHYELELLVAGLWGVFWAFLGVILFKKLTFSALVVGIVSAFI